MPNRITPIDVSTYANPEIFRLGEKIFENDLVKHRFLTDYGLRATVRGKGKYQVEMIVEDEQLFGRCNCEAGSSPCEHKVAALLSWLNEPENFISIVKLKRTIKGLDKNTIVEVILDLVEIFPELCHFFIHPQDTDEVTALRENVADIFDFPHKEKINPSEIVEPSKILFAQAKYLRHENKWRQARILLFEILNRILALIDHNQLSSPFQDSFITGIADDYIDIVLTDTEPDESHREEIRNEVKELLEHPSADEYGIVLEPLNSQ